MLSDDKQKVTIRHDYGENGKAIYVPCSKEKALEHVAEIFNCSQQ